MTDLTPQIEINNLSKVFQHRGTELEVLKDLSLRLYQGDRVSIMGPSGAGKSTLLQIMGTLDAPSSGSMAYQGQSVFDQSEAALAKFRNAHVGFVFQFHHLLPEFTALENVMMPGLIQRQTRSTASQRAAELLKDVGLDHRHNHKPGELSGGEQQRVAIARALFNKPQILLADEPTGNLDQTTSQSIHELLYRINQTTNVTIIVVTHDPELASQMDIQLLVHNKQLITTNTDITSIGDRLSHTSPSS